MLIVTKRRYKRQHVIGGAGFFDTVVNFIKRVANSNAAKTVASKLASAAQTDVGKKAIEAVKTAGKEIILKGIDVGKDAAIAKAKAVIDRAASKPQMALNASNAPTSPKSQEVSRPVISQNSKDTLAALINLGATTNINKLLAGSGVRSNNAHAKPTAISIQDLVKYLNKNLNTGAAYGSGLRAA